MTSSVSPDASTRAHTTQQRPAARTRTDVVRTNYWVLKLSKAWLAIQLTTYGGKYSIERALALDEYIQTTPLYRVVLVCLAVPTTLILLVFGQESIPLQDPLEGWSSNYGFWVRVWLLGGAVGYAAATYVGYMIDGASLSRRQLALFTLGVAISYTAVNIAVAAWMVFPIPFLAFSTNMFIMFILMGLYRIIVGASVFREVLARRGQLLPFKNFVLVQVSMLLFYPAFQVLFGEVTNTRWEVPALVILPITKLVMKNLMVRTITHREDMIPEEVIFIVDFFDALYLATCMQIASSTTSVVAVVSVHLLQSAVELNELRRKTRRIFVRVHKVTGLQDRNVPAAARALCQKLKSELHADYSSVQVYSSVPHLVSAESKVLFEELKYNQKVVSSSKSPTRPTRRKHGLQNLLSFRTTIHPASYTPARSSNTKISRSSASYSSAKRKTVECARLLHDVAEVLFTSECLVLTEFLETVIPNLYGSYLLLMIRLPSAEYHTEMARVTKENVGGMVQGIFIYGVIEWLSCAAVAIVMYRDCGIRVLHQLALVIETQMHLVQAKLVLYVMITLTFRVVHFGRFEQELGTPNPFAL